MEYHTNIISETSPLTVMRGKTGIWYHYNIVAKEGTRPDTNETYTYYQYDGFWFPDAEYQGVQEGRLPNNSRGWDATLWEIFKDYQHSRTIPLYITAQRHIRNSDSGWEEYVQLLDSWNNTVDTIAMGILPPSPPTPPT